jgi:hemoglobin-like flavoprotein
LWFDAQRAGVPVRTRSIIAKPITGPPQVGDQREIFQSIISHTGRKHADFGVQAPHFIAFGEALIWGLQRQFGAAFTPEMQQAWIVLYDAIQAEMMRAAKTQV